MREAADIFIFKDGNKLGPYTQAALEESLRVGSLPGDTPSWTAKNRKWRPLEVLIAERKLPASPVEVTAPASLQGVGKTAPNSGGDGNVRHVSEPNKSAYKYVLISISVVAALMIVALMRNSDGSGGIAAPSSAATTDQSPRSDLTLPFTGNIRLARSLEEAESCVLMATTPEGNGSAFVAKVDGKNYIYTNVHVASSDSILFEDFQGRKVDFDPHGEVVKWDWSSGQGTDIVRFPLITRRNFALRLAEHDQIKSRAKVWALGDSGGENILMSLPGKIVGVGPDKIEVDCEFVPGNSGGPIVNQSAEVVGIASYMKHDESPWAKGTQQEIRRIAWIPGGDHNWAVSSHEELFEEMKLVRGCGFTSCLLLVVLDLKATENGFEVGDYLGEFSLSIIDKTDGHPLTNGIYETSKSVSNFLAGASKRQQAYREYLVFYDSCSRFQSSQIQESERNVMSAFWRSRLEPYISNYKDLLERFEAKLEIYNSSASPYGSLGDR